MAIPPISAWLGTLITLFLIRICISLAGIPFDAPISRLIGTLLALSLLALAATALHVTIKNYHKKRAIAE
jgi:hypothetical protein